MEHLQLHAEQGFHNAREQTHTPYTGTQFPPCHHH